MNIDVVGRILPSQHIEGDHGLHISSRGKTVATSPGVRSVSFSFQELFGGDVATQEVFTKTVEPLLGVFMEGMNVAVLTFGETGSGKSYTLTGEASDRSGIIPLVIDYVYGELLQQVPQHSDTPPSRYQRRSAQSSNWSLFMSMYEIHSEVLRDLLQPVKQAATMIELAYTAKDGAHIKGLNHMAVSSAADATTLFRQGWARRTGATADIGPASSHSIIVTQFHLENTTNESYSTKSWLKIIDLPGAEKLAEDVNLLQLQEGPMTNKSLLAFSRMVDSLVGVSIPERVINYSDSKLTQLLEDVIGGNCKTRVICCLRPNPEPQNLTAILKTCSSLSQVKNFPVLYDYNTESLIIQYRARILAAQQNTRKHMGEKENVGTLKDQLRRLTNENVQLRDKNERLYTKLNELQEKMGKLAGSKTDLSSKLIFSEEEKLKISKDLIELQIQMNNMREQYEAEIFELKNAILTYENRIAELESQRDKVTHENQIAQERLRAVEKNRKELADEYIVLKSNFLALSKEHEEEVSKNDALGLELLNMANAKSSLKNEQESYAKSRALYEEAAAELERVRALVTHMSSRRLKPEDITASEIDRRKVEKNLLGNRDHILQELELMKKMHSEQQQKLSDKIVAMSKELQEAKKAIRNTQHKIAEQSASLLTSQSQVKEVETENSRLQMQLKELNEAYRSRLSRYIEDIAEYVDGTAKGPDGTNHAPVDTARMKRFVDSMLKDIRSSYKSREEQLATAARSYKKRLQNLTKRHENLLIAYRIQREQMLALGDVGLDPGPPEYHFSIIDGDLQSSLAQEVNNLREDKVRLEAQLQQAKDKVRIVETSVVIISFPQLGSSGKLGEEAWAEIRKQLREFTHSTQEDLERERAQLLTRAAMAEEQLLELQEYVDKHLARYKQEILRLRKLLGNEAPRSFSAGTAETVKFHRSMAKTSKEL
ncbi:coiled-coil domain-containing protein 78 [Protopterus annectens]|uniref:coiled-coil domain-containing protein 78 n=1 Tax=Protopterus annectens TaxID=7888 RepID=UPI001CF99F59|nr:coiled-coil domain-containing protein 78 [Protopterus annectens]